jgi:hypothetical protein
MSEGVRVALLFAALFSASAISAAFLPLWFADRGLDAVAIGQVLCAAALLRVIAGPCWGAVTDRIGSRSMMLAASITASAAALFYVPSHGFLLLLLVAAVQGVASSALNPLTDSLALALARDGRMEIRHGALDRLDRLHGGERGSGLAADRHRFLACALALPRATSPAQRRRHCCRRPTPGGVCSAHWRGRICSQSARSA